jgi:outer membrane biogenesis lipoprotein LolB
MAAAQHYQPQSVAFPQDEPGNAPPLLEHVAEAAIRQQLRSSLPVDSLLDWLHTHHGHLQDATLLRLFHELQNESSWQIEASAHPETTTLQAIRVLHHPHRVSLPE